MNAQKVSMYAQAEVELNKKKKEGVKKRAVR